MTPIVCDGCGSRFSPGSFSEEDLQTLALLHSYQGLVDELQMLKRVQAYYRRHPGVEGRIKSSFSQLIESQDPRIQEQLCAGVPFHEIELPPKDSSVPPVDSPEDAQVVDYLRSHEFVLLPRLKFVAGEIVRIESSTSAVRCPSCQTGLLRVQNWDEFNSHGAVTFYWPHRHSLDTDGTLHMKVTGYCRDGHWTGEQAIRPDKRDYAFWCWLVKQRAYHRILQDTELPPIRALWSRRTGRNN